jgi:hypothetical protein
MVRAAQTADDLCDPRMRLAGQIINLIALCPPSANWRKTLIDSSLACVLPSSPCPGRRHADARPHPSLAHSAGPRSTTLSPRRRRIRSCSSTSARSTPRSATLPSPRSTSSSRPRGTRPGCSASSASNGRPRAPSTLRPTSSGRPSLFCSRVRQPSARLRRACRPSSRSW